MIKIPNSDLTYTFKFFYRILGNKLFVTFILFSFVALLEGIGFIAFIPLISGELPSLFDIPLLNDLKANRTASIFLILSMFISKALIAFLALWRLSGYTGEIYYSIKTEMFSSALNTEYLTFNKRDTGHYINLINDQTTRSLSAFHHLNQAIISFVQGSILVGIGFLTAWEYSIYLVLSAAVILFLFGFLNRHVSDWSDEYSTRAAMLSQKCIEYIRSWKYFVATGKIESAVRDINLKSKKLISFFLKMTVAGHFTATLREPIAVLVISILLLYEIEFGDGSIAPILVSLVFFYRAMNYFLSFQQSRQGISDSIGALRLLDGESKQLLTTTEQKRLVKVEKVSSIEFHNVDFSYNDGRFVLHRANFSIQPAAINSIVGQSGVGKTTVAALLTGLVKPDHGEILVNERGLNSLDLKNWRNKIGYVTQEPVIIEGTIFDNICMPEHSFEKANFDKARSAIKHAGLDKFVDSLPAMMDTHIGDQGFNLSGGQKQRMAIAREIYRDVEFLILDEPSSALDKNSEMLIIKTLQKLSNSRCTIICITHSESILAVSHNIIRLIPTKV